MATPVTDMAAPKDGGRGGREVARRVFAGEFNAATLEYKDGGERSPTYVITPLGAKVNRLLVVGVLTSTETIGAAGDMWRAQVTDPTGVFNIYAGQFQPDAASAISELKPPTIVAAVGKSRTYQPEDGVTYTSIRPETIKVVEVADRDRWLLETAAATMDRIECVQEALKLELPTTEALVNMGYDVDLAEGVVRALAHYGPPDVARFAALVRDGLEMILPDAAGRVNLPAPREPAPAAPATGSAPAGAGNASPMAPPASPAAPAAATTTARQDEIEDMVLGFVERLDDGKGAPWEDIVSDAGAKGVTEEEVEESLNNLMDKGLIFEPVLGKLKKT